MKYTNGVIFTVFITILIFTNIYAQTNTFPSSGNVGIGTTSPVDGLDVKNTNIVIRNLSNSTGNSAIMISQAINNTGYQTFGTSLRTYVEDYGQNRYALQLFTQQSWSTGQTEKMRISGNGYVGIGTSNPGQKLSIYDDGKAAVEFKRGIASGQVEQNDSGGALRLQDLNGNTLIQLRTYGNSYFKGGNIGIGTDAPIYNLDVNGIIHAHEIKVDLQNGSDFVFKNDYNLMNISDLEEYITENQHLPEIASEQEMISDGINMKEFQMKLLQKIEELTLYAINQNRALDNQNKRIEELEKEIKTIKNQKTK